MEMEIGNVRAIDIESEMRTAYLDYAMSVIVARALPDARDGLKPVQRRILYACYDMGLRSNTPYKKSARIVGEVLGKYHPHGDSAVYEAMARMAQDFSMRYMLIDGQGNFGSIDGDAPAAMRYTEARLSAMAEELLTDIGKDTVDWVDNFDGTLKEPTVLPANAPNLLINGASGIAVGMATNLPPHNLGEVVDATCYLIDRWNELEDVALEDLMAFVKGPDFPTGAHILGREGIISAYATGKGRIVMRAVSRIEEIKGGRYRIVVTELPYQVNKAALVERIADLVRDGRLSDVSDLRDESDRTGIGLVIELKRGAQARTVLNQLLKLTPLQSTFGVQLLALVDGQPRLLTLKRALQIFIEHRCEVITRRTRFELNKALARAHILMGLYVALDFLDEVISIIRQSPDADTAKQRLMQRLRLSPQETRALMQRLAFDHAQLVALMTPLHLDTQEEQGVDDFARQNLVSEERFELTEIQAQAILDMQLRRLAALERQKLADEYQAVLAQMIYLKYLLAHPHKILGLIKDDLLALKAKYGDARRTHILSDATEEFSETDLIPDQHVLISVTQRGYVKRVLSKAYRAQARGSKGVQGMQTIEEDAVLYIFAARTLDYVLFFSDKGKVYQVRAYDIPDTDRAGKGSPLINLIALSNDEHVTAAIPVPSNSIQSEQSPAEGNGQPEGYLVMATRYGRIKRMGLAEMSSVRPSGIIAISLDEEDVLGWVKLTEGGQEVILVTERGQAARFNEDEVRLMGRAAGGVNAIKLSDGDAVTSMDIAAPGGELLLVTAFGYGKRTALDEYPVKGRYTGGVRTLGGDLSQTGPVAAARVVFPNDEVTLITASGLALRTLVSEIPTSGRATRGARIIKLGKDDRVASVARMTQVTQADVASA